MTFEEKISIILNTNTLGIATIDDLSERAGFSKDTIRKAISRKSSLNPRNTRTFLDNLGINPSWWDTGKGEIFTEKHTSVQNKGENQEIPLGVNLDEESKRLLEIANKTVEYAFIPKTILEGEYRIELKSQLDERRIALTETLDAYKKLVKRLEDEVADLRSGKIPIAVTATQDAK